MSQKDDEFLEKLQTAFRAEAEEHLQAISSGVLELEKAPDPDRRKQIVASIFREAHSLKGAARAVNQDDIEVICQSLESVFAAWKKQDYSPAPDLFDPLHHAINTVEKLLPSTGGVEMGLDKSHITKLLHQLSALEAGPPVHARPSQQGSAPGTPNAGAAPGEPARPRRRQAMTAPPPAPDLAPEGTVRQSGTPPTVPPPQDARNGGVERKTNVPPSSAPQPGREAASQPISQTLRVSTAKLEDLLREAEELLAVKLNANQRALDLHAISALLTSWEKEWTKISSEIHAVRQSMAAEGSEDARALSPALANRILEFLDWNHDLVRTVDDRLTAVTRLADHDRRDAGSRVDALLEDAKQLMMLPFATLFALFPKLVRELSRDQGKQIELEMQGGEIEIDKRILEQLKDPLIHLLRNSIDHGIEPSDKRTEAGKPLRGVIRLSVAQVEGNKVEVLMSDDGGGINAASVRAAAVRHGTLTLEESEKLSDADAVGLIFEPEISTSPIITEISGRGLGLAIVREKVEELGGRVVMETRLGAGTSFRLTLPLTLATFRGILVQAGEQLFVLPTISVDRVKRIQPDEIRTVEGRETIRLGGRAVSLVRLEEVLELPRRGGLESTGFMPIVVLGSGEKRIAFGVDAVLSEQEVLVKPLGKPLTRVRNIAGATVLGSGRAAPILNVTDLVKSAAKLGPANRDGASASPLDQRKSILVVEDSITARMLIKNILESAGHRVKTAVDGVDAFAQLRGEAFDLVVSDVEMPRMNGFDLTARIRADKRLADLPVILVTALASQEDRERGVDVGANAYIVKSSFDQSNLLDVMRRLL